MTLANRWITLGAVAVATSIALVQAQNPPKHESERNIKESDVPAAALAALRKLAGGAEKFNEFEEETENGVRIYEAEWNGPNGEMEAEVTENGEVVEIEEHVPLASIPPAVRAEAERQAGKDARVQIEKKTYFLYEVEFSKNGQGHEILVSPDGRTLHEEKEDDGPEDDAEGEDE